VTNIMQWTTDERTAQAATAYPLLIKRNVPAPQFAGCNTHSKIWNDRVISPAIWNDGPLRSEPGEIIKQFQDGRYTQALALVVSWGGMGRRSKAIYGDRKRERIRQIERTLHGCAQDIGKMHSISESWSLLTGGNDGQMGWSAVMTSKTLHFLCRALGFEQNPPVAIDNKAIRERVWPTFRDSIPFDRRPSDWEGNTFEAYCRYMTAILTWASQKHWTTTQLENTLFDQFL
jgi:hypothetical protein